MIFLILRRNQYVLNWICYDGSPEQPHTKQRVIM